MRIERVERDETPVLFLRAAGDAPEIAPQLWERLEAAIGDLCGRRFYGTFDPDAGEYRACVEPRDGDDAGVLGLERGSIAGGASCGHACAGSRRGCTTGSVRPRSSLSGAASATLLGRTSSTTAAATRSTC